MARLGSSEKRKLLAREEIILVLDEQSEVFSSPDLHPTKVVTLYCEKLTLALLVPKS